MNIELRKISHNQSLSEETNAYSAQVWVDGQHVCDVSNHGQGGPDMQYPAKGKTNADIAALNDKIKATYPPQSYVAGGDKFDYPTDLEVVCGQLLTDHLIGRDLKRLLTRTIVFHDPVSKKVLHYKTCKVDAHRRQLCDVTMKKYPQAEILNQMKFEDALKLYKQVG